MHGLNAMFYFHEQNQITFKTRVPSVDRYVFVVHFRQPEHPSFPVEVLVDGGRPWVGEFHFAFILDVRTVLTNVKQGIL